MSAGLTGAAESNDDAGTDENAPVIDLSGAVGQPIPESVAPSDVPDAAPAQGDHPDDTPNEPSAVPYVNPVSAPPAD